MVTDNTYLVDKGWVDPIKHWEMTVRHNEELIDRFAVESKLRLKNPPKFITQQELKQRYQLEVVRILKSCIHSAQERYVEADDNFCRECSYTFDVQEVIGEFTKAPANQMVKKLDYSKEIGSLNRDSTHHINTGFNSEKRQENEDQTNDVSKTNPPLEESSRAQNKDLKENKTPRQLVEFILNNLGSIQQSLNKLMKIATMDLNKVVPDQSISSACFLASDKDRLELIYSKWSLVKNLPQTSIEQLSNVLSKQSIKLTQLSAPKERTRVDLVIVKKAGMSEDQLVYFETETITSVGPASKEKIHMYIYLLQPKQFKRLLAFPNHADYNLTDFIRRSPEGNYLALMIDRKKILVMLNYSLSDFHNNVGAAIYTINTDEPVLDYQLRDVKVDKKRRVFCLLYLEGGSLELRLIDEEEKKEVMELIVIRLKDDTEFDAECDKKPEKKEKEPEKKTNEIIDPNIEAKYDENVETREKDRSKYTSIYMNLLKRDQETLINFGLVQEKKGRAEARLHVYAYKLKIEEKQPPEPEYEGHHWVDVPLEAGPTSDKPRYEFFQLEKTIKDHSKLEIYGISKDLDAGVKISISGHSNSYFIDVNTWPKSEFASFTKKQRGPGKEDGREKNEDNGLKILRMFHQVQKDQVVLSLTGKRLMQIQVA